MVDKKALIDFEEELAVLYTAGKIRGPVHFHVGAEDGLIEVFKHHYKEGDWIVSTHRSHYPWLLSGRSPEELKKQILAKHSMHVFGDKFITSAIVAGGVSIAIGLALSLQIQKSKNKVLCFIGDAASNCGIALECFRYAKGHDLPILFVIEDNKFCVRANTEEVWGTGTTDKTLTIQYERKYPHAGCGTYVMF